MEKQKIEKITATNFKQLDKSAETSTFELNGTVFEYKPFLSIEEKIGLVEKILNSTFYKKVEDKMIYIGFNTMRLEISKVFCIFEAYVTNVVFPKKDGENDLFKSYNIILSSGIYNLLFSNIRSEFVHLDELINNRVNDILTAKRINIEYSLHELIDLMREREQVEVEGMKLQNLQLEKTLNMMPDDLESANKSMEEMVAKMNELSSNETFQVIQEVMSKNRKGEVAAMKKEVESNGEEVQEQSL